MDKPNLVLIGGGGHCISIIDVVELENKYNIVGILDAFIDIKEIMGYPVLGGDGLIPHYAKNPNTYFLIAVGQIKNYKIRKRVSYELEKNNCKLATVISPRAYVSRHSLIGEGTIIMHDALVNAKVSIGKHCIINSKANLEHDVKIGNFCHVSTGVIVNGNTEVKEGTFVGSNATLSHNIIVEEDSVIGAGKFIK